MKQVIANFLNKYVALSEKEINEITIGFKQKSLKKNDYLLRQGETCKDIVIVENGCLRMYYLKDDVEVSVWFAFKESSAIEMYSFISGNPSEYFIQAIEDSEIIYLPKSELTKLYQTIPKTQELMKHFWEDVILNLISRFTSLQKDTAEERYLALLKNPVYMASIPQKYLASFIGITPTSLSRIRRNIK
ncbi:MAG: Crp/Fnr family transcriptional regulator [Bacteroidota bacterium]